MEDVVEVKNVWKYYTKNIFEGIFKRKKISFAALKGVSFTLKRGKVSV